MRSSLTICSSIMAGLCLVVFAGPASGASVAKSYKNIREVDFRNFTYQPKMCHGEFGDIGIGKSVNVKKGDFQAEDMGIGGGEFNVSSIAYGDLNGDGAEEAVVEAECGSQSGNYRRSELFVFSLKKGGPTVMASVSDSDFDEEYKKQFHVKYKAFNYIVKNGLNIKDGVLVVGWTAEGRQAEPDYFVTIKYALKGNSMQAAGKPGRRPCNSRCSWEKGLPD